MPNLSRQQPATKHRAKKAEQARLPASSPQCSGKRKSRCLESGDESEKTPPQDSKRNGVPSKDRSTPPKGSPQQGSKEAGVESGIAVAITRKATQSQHLRVCGPLNMQTLRGQLLGREVAMIICGEAHENAIDLTRHNSITKRMCEWTEISKDDRAGFNHKEAVATKRDVSLKVAKSWAERMVTKYSWGCEEEKCEEDSSSELEEGGFYYYEDTDPEAEAEWEAKQIATRGGHFFMFVPHSKAKGSKGIARIFARPLLPSLDHPLPANALLFEYADVDEQARENHSRQFTNVPIAVQDAIIDDRKLKRLEDGYEMFDDWVIRHVNDSFAHVEFLSEAPVKPQEVELHVGSLGVRSTPVAHKCLREIGSDDEGEEDPAAQDDGTGSYLDYLLRRVAAHIPPDRNHGVDPRILGVDPIYEDLASKHAFEDEEETILNELGHVREKMPPVMPSWEAFFGATAQLLYYFTGVKADYAPFLRTCVGSSESLRNFFKELYFGTMQEAVSNLRYDETSRPMTRIRSLTWDQNIVGAPRIVRPDAREVLPIQSAPIESCIKARGSGPARTWISGLAEQIRRAGATDLVARAQAWYMDSVNLLLTDPKIGDDSGDYFAAWLRECYRDIYMDIDYSDPSKLRNSNKMYSFDKPRSKRLCHNLKDIKIPSMDAAFEELRKWDPEERVSTNRERVMAQILLDAFQLRLVDLSAILKMAALAATAPGDKPVVLILYAGEDHTLNVVDFWRSQGFSHGALPKKGYVGKRRYKEDEPRSLSLPSYLHDFKELFSLG